MHRVKGEMSLVLLEEPLPPVDATAGWLKNGVPGQKPTSLADLEVGARPNKTDRLLVPSISSIPMPINILHLSVAKTAHTGKIR